MAAGRTHTHTHTSRHAQTNTQIHTQSQMHTHTQTQRQTDSVTEVKVRRPPVPLRCCHVLRRESALTGLTDGELHHVRHDDLEQRGREVDDLKGLTHTHVKLTAQNTKTFTLLQINGK